MTFFNKIINNMNFGWALIIIFILGISISFFYKKQIKKRFYICFFIILMVGFYILDYLIVPPESFDLFRYYDELEYYRNLDFVDSFNMIFSRPNFLWYFLLRICALFNNNKIILFFTTTVFLSIMIYILYNIKKRYYLSNKQTAISILAFFSIVNFIHTLSGLRNILAASIFSYGFSLLIFNNKKSIKFIGYIIMFISVFIHPMTGIFLVFLLVHNIFAKIKYCEIVLLFWNKFSNIILYFLAFVPLPIFNLYVEKFRLEISTDFGNDIRIFIFEIIEMLYFLYLLFNLQNKVNNIKQNEKSITVDEICEKKYINFFYYLTIFIIGSTGLINIFIRCRFLVAYFIPLIFALKNKHLNLKYNFEFLMLAIVLFINFYYIYYMMCNGIF